jgi:F-type H+-transporting ATPase subunit delta
MPKIADELQQMVFDYKNQAIAEVTTATPMDENQRTVVKQALEHKTGKQILLHTRVDPSILGGVVARVGDQIIDGSVRYRLAALQQRLLNGVASADIDFLSDESASGQDAPALPL